MRAPLQLAPSSCLLLGPLLLLGSWSLAPYSWAPELGSAKQTSLGSHWMSGSALAAGGGEFRKASPATLTFWVLESEQALEYELHLLPVVTWISYLNTLSISLCSCEMGIRVVDAWVIVRNSESVTTVFIACCSRTNVRALNFFFLFSFFKV